jgi:anti-sigma regulatory factor (Ser/Thr protein kinase)
MELEQTVTQAQTTTSPGEAAPNLMDLPLSITIILPTQAYFISGIRDFTLHMTQNLTGFSEKWAFRFQAIVDELCNNAIEHGSAPGKEIKITFVSTKGKSLEVIVEDTGTAKEKMTAQQMTDLLKQRKQLMSTQYLGFRGRGLPKIVGEWTDELVFEDVPTGGLRIKIKKYLRKEEDNVSSQAAGSTHLILK